MIFAPPPATRSCWIHPWLTGLESILSPATIQQMSKGILPFGLSQPLVARKLHKQTRAFGICLLYCYGLAQLQEWDLTRGNWFFKDKNIFKTILTAPGFTVYPELLQLMHIIDRCINHTGWSAINYPNKRLLKMP